jgi:hypothetical protein
VSNLVQEYYRQIKIGQAKQLGKGVLGWAPAYYLPETLTTLELVHYNPSNELQNRYAVAKPQSNILFNHTPVHELHLESNEELLVIKAKRRKFVILCEAPDYGSGGESRLCERCCIGLPLWTFHPTDSEDFKLRIKALEYPWWIYLPEAKALGMQEGFVRLDRFLVIPLPLMEPLPLSLSEDAMYLVTEWFRYYSTGQIDPLFMEDRTALIQALNAGPTH